jgi:hypothetical protein
MFIFELVLFFFIFIIIAYGPHPVDLLSVIFISHVAIIGYPQLTAQLTELMNISVIFNGRKLIRSCNLMGFISFFLFLIIIGKISLFGMIL